MIFSYHFLPISMLEEPIKIALNHFTPHTCVAYDASIRSNTPSICKMKKNLDLVYDEF